MFEKEIDRLVNSNQNNSLVIFVGSGISLDSHLPKWEDIINDMYKSLYDKKLSRELYSDEYLTIPQKLYDFDAKKYKKKFTDAFNDIDENPNKLDDLIVSLKPDHIITTNYDHLLEKSLIKQELDYKYGVVYDDETFINKAQKYDHYLIKMHGDLDDFDSIVLKENDYLNYENKRPFTSNYINNLLATHIFLFVGYSMSDYNFKIILNNTNNFRRQMNNRKDIYNNIWVDNVNENYDIEKLYYKENNVDVVNLKFLNNQKTISDNLYDFLNDVRLGWRKNKNYDDKKAYEKLNYVSHFEIDSLMPTYELLGGVRLYKDNDFQDIVKHYKSLEPLFNKTSNYTILDKTNGEKTELGIKISDQAVYEKVLSGKYNEINYEKEKISLKDKQYLYYMFEMSDKFDYLEQGNNYNTDKFNAIIIDHNFEMINSSYKLINTDKYLHGYYIFKIIDGNVIDEKKYDSILDDQKNKYDLSDNAFYLDFKNDEYDLENFGNLTSVKDISEDLFRYEIVNRLILKDSINIRVFKLLFQCILCTYNHNINEEKNMVNVKNDYKISLNDFVIIVNKLDINYIQQMINDYNIEFLQFNKINEIINYIQNLCNAYTEKITVWNRDFIRKISRMISKSILLVSFSEEMSAEQISIIVKNIYNISLKGNIIGSRKIYDTFNQFFIDKLINNNKSLPACEEVLLHILKNKESFSMIFGGNIFNVSLASFLRDVVNRNYLDFSNIDLNEIKLSNNIIYGCVFIPVLLDNGENVLNLIKSESDIVILSIAELMTNKELPAKNLNFVFKELIQKSYKPNLIDSELDYRFTLLLNLKSLGAKMTSNDKYQSYNKDYYRINRLFGFIVDDINFSYKDIDILDVFWIPAIKFDINNNYYIVNKLKKHKKELLNSSLKYKLKHSLLDENEMLVLMLIGFTAQELIQI